MNVEEHNTARRSNWRYALAWTLRRPSRAAFLIVLLALAGTASALGLLRWQLPLLQWSFAAICWLAALGILVKLALRDREGK
jgi:hypothetical protein